MKDKEQIEKQLIKLLKDQVDRLESGDTSDIIMYKMIRHQIFALEDILELNVINNDYCEDKTGLTYRG